MIFLDLGDGLLTENHEGQMRCKLKLWVKTRPNKSNDIFCGTIYFKCSRLRDPSQAGVDLDTPRENSQTQISYMCVGIISLVTFFDLTNSLAWPSDVVMVATAKMLGSTHDMKTALLCNRQPQQQIDHIKKPSNFIK